MWLHWYKIDELVQERRNFIANALELRLSCTSPSKYSMKQIVHLYKFKHISL